MTTRYSRPGPMSAWHPSALSRCAGCIDQGQALAVLAACGEADLVPHSGVPAEAVIRMVTAIGLAAVAAQ